MMAFEQFIETMDTLGADLSIWPDEDRKHAEALLAASPVARAYFTADQTVDHALIRMEEKAPANLLERIMHVVGDDSLPS